MKSTTVRGRVPVVIACLLGSLAVYCAQAASSGNGNGPGAGADGGGGGPADPTPTANAAECEPKPREFLKLGEGHFAAPGASNPIKVQGYTEIVVAQKRPLAGHSAYPLVAEFALAGDGFFGSTGQLTAYGSTRGTGEPNTNSGGARLRVDGNFVRFSSDGADVIDYEVWGVK